MFDRLKTRLRRKPSLPAERPEAGEGSAAEAIRRKYFHFHLMLGAHHEVLETMAELESRLDNPEPLTMKGLWGKVTSLAVNCRRMVRDLNIMAEGRYAELEESLETIEAGLDQALLPVLPPLSPELVLDLGVLTKEAADQAGAKMANLGEVRNRLGLPTPDGFVLTFAAAKLFLDRAGLYQKINERLAHLDVTNLAQVQKASADIQRLILDAPAAEEVVQALGRGYEDLCRREGGRVRVALRSSALGEDSETLSFAGLYLSVFNLAGQDLLDGYRQVLASAYSPQAILYQSAHGLRHDEILMAVGCLTMVEARSAGIATTIDPLGQRQEAVVVSSVWGLGRLAVDGSLQPDITVVDRRDGAIRHREIAAKPARYVCLAEEGICRLEEVGAQASEPSLSEAEAQAVAAASVRLDEHYGSPQEVEWVIDQGGRLFFLQTRPLAIAKLAARPGPEEAAEPAEAEARILLSGGVRVQAGVTAGPVHLVKKDEDVAAFQSGSILVAVAPEPRLAALMNLAAAVVTDMGGMLGHLATVAREYNLPAIFGLGRATQVLEQGREITVDARRGVVYEGRVETLLAAQLRTKRPRPETSIHLTLKRTLAHVSPLALLDPAAADFTARSCRTMHDVTRFCHEKALAEMFILGDQGIGRDPGVKRVRTPIPLKLWLIDLGDGLTEEGQDLPEITIKHVASKPMQAFWKGATHPGVRWSGPVNLNMGGFMHVVMQSAAGMHQAQRPMGENSYFVVGRNYMNFNSRLAYHFATVGSYLCADPSYNYVSFRMQGGAASSRRRELRAMFLAQVLRDLDFSVTQRGDLVEGRLQRRDEATTAERLDLVGRLMGCARQLDMVMSDEEVVRLHVRAFFEGNYSFSMGTE